MAIKYHCSTIKNTKNYLSWKNYSVIDNQFVDPPIGHIAKHIIKYEIKRQLFYLKHWFEHRILVMPSLALGPATTAASCVDPAAGRADLTASRVNLAAGRAPVPP